MFFGFVPLNGTLVDAVVTRNQGNAPLEPDSAPTFRVYGPNGFVPGSNGTATKLDTGTITGATNASPIVITEPNHGLISGVTLSIVGIVGNLAANGTWSITVIDGNTYSLNGSVGNGNYSSGGSRHVAGLWQLSIPALSSLGFESGQTYTVLVSYSIGGQSFSDEYSFTVQ